MYTQITHTSNSALRNNFLVLIFNKLNSDANAISTLAREIQDKKESTYRQEKGGKRVAEKWS